MANIIDISSRLEAVKPVLKLSDTEQYPINDDKNAVLKANQLMSGKTQEGESEFDDVYKTLELLLGKDALKQIEQLHPGATKGVNQLMVIFLATMAGVSGTSFEDMEARFQKTKVE